MRKALDIRCQLHDHLLALQVRKKSFSIVLGLCQSPSHLLPIFNVLWTEHCAGGIGANAQL
jgi:hypothetical protein